MVRASGGVSGVVNVKGDKAETGVKHEPEDQKQLVGSSKWRNGVETGNIQAMQLAPLGMVMLRKGTPDSVAATTPSPSSSSSTTEPALIFNPNFSSSSMRMRSGHEKQCGRLP